MSGAEHGWPIVEPLPGDSDDASLRDIDGQEAVPEPFTGFTGQVTIMDRKNRPPPRMPTPLEKLVSELPIYTGSQHAPERTPVRF